jgi:membrane-associated protein
MRYPYFLSYNIFGGIGWIAGISLAGYASATLPWVKDNLKLTLMLIILVSLVPAVLAYLKHRWFDKGSGAPAGEQKDKVEPPQA